MLDSRNDTVKCELSFLALSRMAYVDQIVAALCLALTSHLCPDLTLQSVARVWSDAEPAWWPPP